MMARRLVSIASLLSGSCVVVLGACSSSSSDSSSSASDGGSSTSPDSGGSSDGGTTSADGGTVAVGAPSAPTNVRMILQGQDTKGDTPSAPTPTDPNRTDISWTAAIAGENPIDHYNIYRSTDGTTYTSYGTATTTTFSDKAATNCVSGTAGTTPPYYAATTYWYKVTAVDSKGTEGPKSPSQSFAMYENGTYNWGSDYDYGNLTSDYADTTGAPESGSADIKNTLNGAYGGWLPFAGNEVTQWNMWAGAFSNLEFDLKPTVANQTWSLYAVRVGDKPIYDNTGAQYTVDPTDYGPAPKVGVWAHYKVPLAKILTDYGPSGSGPAVVQYAVYKWSIQDKTGSATGSWYVDNVLYTP